MAVCTRVRLIAAASVALARAEASVRLPSSKSSNGTFHSEISIPEYRRQIEDMNIVDAAIKLNWHRFEYNENDIKYKTSVWCTIIQSRHITLL
jgi:hypothetical protein